MIPQLRKHPEALIEWPPRIYDAYKRKNKNELATETSDRENQWLHPYSTFIRFCLV